MSQTVKNLPKVQDTRVQSLGRENPLEKGVATGTLQSMGFQRVGHDCLTNKELHQGVLC